MQSSGIVLVVEDDPDWQETLCEMLSKAAYSYKLATDYNSGLKELRKQDISALILDLQLRTEHPENEDFIGWSLAQQALERNVPIIVVTGHASVSEANKAFRKYKVIAFLDKGLLNETELLARVSEGVEASRQRKFSDSEKQRVFQQMQELFFGGKPIKPGTGKRR